MNPQILQTIAPILAALAAVLGGLYAVVTRPLQALFKAEINVLRQEIKVDLAAMELRINERIDARIVRK
jgi:hypothetical protein